MKVKMKMQLFGNFCLEYEGVRLDEDALHSNKLTRLLAYVLINRDKTLTRQKLIDTFWEDDSRNPESALKNLMYRLRAELKVFGEREYICTLPGAYRWNQDIEIETDYEQFEKLSAQIRSLDDEKEKKQLCREAIACFNGNVTPRIAGESWILSKVTWYESLYMDIVKVLANLYEQEEDWSRLEALCNQALLTDMMDEDIHYWVIKSLCGQGKFDLAMLHYEKVSKMLYDSLGVRSSERLQSIISEMILGSEGRVTDINDLMMEVCERGRPKGAFFCDYQVFCQIYHVEARRLKRSGMAENMLLLTVRRSGKLRSERSVDTGLIEGVEILGELLQKTLRVGDVAARYSQTQYIVLLPTCSYEAGVLVAERMKKRFLKAIGRRKLDLVYELGELTASE